MSSCPCCSAAYATQTEKTTTTTTKKQNLFISQISVKLRTKQQQKPEVESSRKHFEVLGLGLEALSPRKLACPRLDDSTIF